ncbi:hypothetical protein BOX30_01070 [Leptospirillum ferriphilum]|uniref:Uncharacterized protein n=2 Tax=Leptospirillum ferriphilum TaxID=178606 RepID=A0A059XS25_9BACT|nr:hypothetical protein Y981_00900 [Leptospirillum ferriphilum YSK]AKS22605.1 hypothetical protein ABH19_00790 [Leptospirillum sp. Group II 'CF-1']OOH69627.1 hypothetical protein BOX24_11360 [Leptospirillum ferriphilum]OOH83850.1 hypothetical protein BOX30_01070 [Leptospirillum ferriphilum]
MLVWEFAHRLTPINFDSVCVPVQRSNYSRSAQGGQEWALAGAGDNMGRKSPERPEKRPPGTPERGKKA